jgi:hypothetical protein
MKVYGALELAQLEWFLDSAKPSAASFIYRVIYVSDLKQIQVSDGINWISAGSRLDSYTSGTVPLASANPNTIIWVSDLQQVQISNGSAWIPVGSGSGVKNYFSQNNANPNFENNSVSPWSACTLTFSGGIPSGAPTLTATQMSIAATASTPLAGTYSMQLTKAAANAQYQGFISGALTIDREDTAKVLYGSFSYEVVSGTVDFSGTSTQTYEIWIYNTVSGAWTQPAGYRGMNQSSGQGKVTFSFQTDGSTANNSYKIAVITQQTGTGAIVVEFDSFQLGPSAMVLGAAMTDWQAYTPTLTGFGTATNVQFQWRRVGDNVEVRGKFTSGTSTATEARATLPSVTSADTGKIPSIQLVGTGSSSVTASNLRTVLIEPSVGYVTFGIASAGPLTKQNGSTLLSSGDTLSFFALVPVQGWSSNVQVSSDTDTRVVAAAMKTTASLATTSGSALVFTGTNFDTHAAYNSSNGRYTCPVSGIYTCELSGLLTTATKVNFSVFKNGSFYNKFAGVAVTTGDVIGSGAIDVECNAGDYLTIVPDQTTTLQYSASLYVPMWNVRRLSGPSVVAASETVTASYSISAGAATADSTQFNFDTKAWDSHNAVNTGAGVWKFTAPISGTYLVSATLYFGANNGNVAVYKNGSNFRSMAGPFGSTATNQTAPGSTLVQLNAGDYIDIRNVSAASRTPATTAATGATISNSNFVTIVRVGN